MPDEIDYDALADATLRAQERRAKEQQQASWASRHATLEQALPGVRAKYDMQLTPDGTLAATFRHGGSDWRLSQVKTGWMLSTQGRQFSATSPEDLDRHLGRAAEERDKQVARLRPEPQGVNWEETRKQQPYGFQREGDVPFPADVDGSPTEIQERIRRRNQGY